MPFHLYQTPNLIDVIRKFMMMMTMTVAMIERLTSVWMTLLRPGTLTLSLDPSLSLSQPEANPSLRRSGIAQIVFFDALNVALKYTTAPARILCAGKSTHMRYDVNSRFRSNAELTAAL